MALDKTILGSLIKTKIKTVQGTDSVDDNLLLLISEAIADAIVTHIKSEALVTVIVSGGSSSGSHNGTIS